MKQHLPVKETDGSRTLKYSDRIFTERIHCIGYAEAEKTLQFPEDGWTALIESETVQQGITKYPSSRLTESEPVWEAWKTEDWRLDRLASDVNRQDGTGTATNEGWSPITATAIAPSRGKSSSWSLHSASWGTAPAVETFAPLPGWKFWIISAHYLSSLRRLSALGTMICNGYSESAVWTRCSIGGQERETNKNVMRLWRDRF